MLKHVIKAACEGRMSSIARIQVLMPTDEADRFDAYCQAKGFKKSTLIVRLIRDHLEREHFTSQPDLFRSGKQRETTQ